MTFAQEWASWVFPKALQTSAVPAVGSQAPSNNQLQLPCGDGKPALIVFLRHCGCPFAEQAFNSLRKTAAAHPDIHCIAISHSDKEATDRWLSSVGGAKANDSDPEVSLIVDSERTLYAAWGLGVASFWHVISPGALYAVYKLGKLGIGVRPTESGSRWQTGGHFLVDGEGKVRDGRRATRTDDIPDWEEMLKALD